MRESSEELFGQRRNLTTGQDFRRRMSGCFSISFFPDCCELNISIFGRPSAAGYFGGFVGVARFGTNVRFVVQCSFPSIVQWNSLVATSI